MNLAKTIKKIMLDPKKFFAGIYKEKGYKKHMHYLILYTIITFLFFTVYYIDGYNKAADFIESYLPDIQYPRFEVGPEVYIIAYIVLTIGFFVISNLRYWLTHHVARFLGAKEPFYQTYKAMVYSLTPEYYTAPLLILVLIIPLFADSFLLWGMWWLISTIVLALSLYLMYIRTMALARMQKISYLRSFLSIYILGLIAQLVAVMLISIILSPVFALIVFLLQKL